MHRFLILALAGFLILLAPHGFAADKLTPPLDGDMSRLKTYDSPEEIPDVLIHSDEGTKHLSDYKGKIVILNLWATWCPPCLHELPALNALQDTSDKTKVQVLAVSVDTTGLEPVKKYLTDNKLTQLPAMMDQDRNIQQLKVLKGIDGIPVTLIIDPQMRVMARYEGEADWGGENFRATLDYYLKHVSFLPYEMKMF